MGSGLLLKYLYVNYDSFSIYLLMTNSDINFEFIEASYFTQILSRVVGSLHFLNFQLHFMIFQWISFCNDNEQLRGSIIIWRCFILCFLSTCNLFSFVWQHNPPKYFIKSPNLVLNNFSVSLPYISELTPMVLPYWSIMTSCSLLIKTHS